MEENVDEAKRLEAFKLQTQNTKPCHTHQIHSVHMA
jgi:hypothetical protein